MTKKHTLTIALMDPPFESARTATAFRIMDAAIKKGHNVNVFAYEGAVYLPFALQAPHANAVHGRDVDEEDHPLPREWVEALFDAAREGNSAFTWVNCGLCVDERGAGQTVDGVRRGTPADLWAMAQDSDNTLIIATA